MVVGLQRLVSASIGLQLERFSLAISIILMVATAISLERYSVEGSRAESDSRSSAKATKRSMDISLLAHHSHIDDKLLQIDESTLAESCIARFVSFR
jgi:hypothetical protein